MRQLSPIKLSIFVLTLIATSTLFSHGNASAATAVDISTCVDLQKIGNDISFPLDGDYTLTGDIDCTDTVNWNANAGFVPIGSSTTPFTGTFNGQNHKIIGLYINLPTTNDIGLIGYSQEATIRNLSMSGGSVSGLRYVGGINGDERSLTMSNVSSNQTVIGAYYVGGIVGWNSSNSTVDTTLSNVHFSGALSHHDASSQLNCYSFAGLIGDNDGNAVITNSSNSGNISDSTTNCIYVGGLTGDSDGDLTISNSYNTGNIGQLSSDNSIGGISGWADNLTIQNSYSSGNVTGGTEVGGIAGYVNQLIISNSYSSGNVTGQTNVGGLLGNVSQMSILNSYSTSNVTGQNNVGGLVGYTDISSSTPDSSTITNSYFSGLISSQDPVTTGGIIGLPNYLDLSGLTITHSFWNSQVSSIENGCGSQTVESVVYTCTPGGFTGLSTYKLQTALTFTDASWDLSQVWGICSTLNNGLPYLLSQGLVCAPAADVGIKAPITGFASITTDQSGKSLDELLLGLAVLAILGLVIPRQNRI